MPESTKDKANQSSKKSKISKKNKKHVEVEEEPVLLAMIPPPSFAPAPHLLPSDSA
jgi:hypothetical protein